MRDYILNNISMKDILYKYGIKTNKDMFSCPFHGKDKKPSAKAYENNFYCFACGANRDVIGFVEQYFNISFKEAMQKINEDFHLGLDSNVKIDYNKINQAKKEREEKEKYKYRLTKEFCKLCDLKRFWKEKMNFIDNYINIKNVDNMLKYKMELRDKVWEIENKIEEIENKMATI